MSTFNEYLLPNQLKFNHINKNETDFLFKEIFEDRIYFQEGLTLDSNPIVLDIGANIGLFSLFIFTQYEGAKVFAFEAIPEIYEVLKSNAKLFNWNVELFNSAISNSNGQKEFIYYPKSTLQSSYYSDRSKNQKFLEAAALNQKNKSSLSFSPLLLDKLINSKLENKTVTCETTTLSQIIKNKKIKKVDLLKIDVEGSEWDVIQGIEPKDWEIIKQVVIEVDNEQNTNLIYNVLTENDFRIKKQNYEPLSGTTICMLYALKQQN